LWAVKSGQYKDTYTPSVRILFDEEDKKEEKNKSRTKK
jgi:cbb3-type cytochrome oxidase maturation protein